MAGKVTSRIHRSGSLAFFRSWHAFESNVSPFSLNVAAIRFLVRGPGLWDDSLETTDAKCEDSQAGLGILSHSSSAFGSGAFCGEQSPHLPMHWMC